MGRLGKLFSLGLLILAGCSRQPDCVYQSTSPDGKITLHAETRQMHVSLREARVSFSTDSQITQVWFGWADSSDGVSVLVCDAVDGPVVIRHSFRKVLQVDFRKSERALVDSLQATFSGHSDKDDDELLSWFCDAPGQAAFSAKFRRMNVSGRPVLLPSTLPTRPTP